MSRYPKLKLVDRPVFPPTIRIPETLGYAGVVFAPQVNHHCHYVDESHVWFSSYDISHGLRQQNHSVQDMISKNRRDLRRQEYFKNGFCLRVPLDYPNAGSTILGSAGDKRRALSQEVLSTAIPALGLSWPTPTTQYPSSPRPTPDVLCRAASMQLAVVPMLVFMLAPLVAALSGDIPENICASTRFLTSGAPLITANNGEPTIHNCFATIYQNPNPQPAHEIPNAHSGHRIAVVRWCGLLVLAAYLIVKWYRAWQGQTDRVSQVCPARRRLSVGRNHAVSSGAPTLADGVHRTRDARAQSPLGRGRRSATATSGNGTTQPKSILDQAAGGLLLVGGPEDESHADGRTDGTVSKVSITPRLSAPGPSSSPRILSTPVQAPPALSTYFSSPFLIRPVANPTANRARRPLRSGPAWALDSRQRSTQQDVLHDIFEPWPHRPNAQTADVFEPRSPCSTRVVLLLPTLYPGLNGHFLPSTTKWFIFVIAVPTMSAPDPKLDLAFLQKVFGPPGSANVCLEWLPKEDTTPENIRVRLCSFYHKAQEAGAPSQLLIYLTGTGDGSSRLCVLDDKVITEQDIGGWLENVCDESVCPQPSLSVFLNICRETMERLDPVDYHLALFWSCSAGQSAYAIYLGEDLPSSLFLIAIFSACHDALVSSKPLKKAFMLRLHRLGEFLEFLYHKTHEASRTCKNCSTWISGKCPPPVPQRPEWERAGLTALVHWGKLIMTGFSDRAREVSDALARKMTQCGFSKAIYSDSTAPPDLVHESLPQGAQPVAQYPRGANKPISQVAGLRA